MPRFTPSVTSALAATVGTSNGRVVRPHGKGRSDSDDESEGDDDDDTPPGPPLPPDYYWSKTHDASRDTLDWSVQAAENYSDKQVEYIESLCPDIVINYCLPPQAHAHPCGQLERNCNRQRLSRFASAYRGSYCDLGGKFNHWLGYQPDHFSVPILQDDDAFRRIDVDRHSVCRCALPKMCDGCRGHAVYTMCDVIYYTGPAALMQVLAQDPTADFVDGILEPQPALFASCLNLSGHRGSFFFDQSAKPKPETTWLRIGK
jgi:hypothetical protein